MIIAIKTDVPLAEIYILKNHSIIANSKWQAHKQLSETIHQVIKQLLQQAGVQLSDLSGVIYYEGPGSFTGLRIGCSVANALAASYGVPITAVSGDDWLAKGQQILASDKASKTVQPNYGSEPHITKAK